MGVSKSPDISQHKMDDLFQGFEFICAYIDELLILEEEYCINHVHKLGLTLNKLK